MKTSSRFILKSFAAPFFATFFISVFVLLMQFLWKYIDEIVGKGLEWDVIVKLLVYVSASLVPMALPLAILLSSLMTFGNLGEQYELVAFKSAGVSLKRILRPLAVLVLLLSGVAFMFSNYWLPIANLKSKSLLYDVKQQKPTMDIRPGIFSDALDDFTIRVKDKKVIDEKEHLYDVLIYDHSGSNGNRSVTSAKEGIIIITDDKRFMEMKLFDGVNYEEELERKSQKSYPLIRTKFEENLIRFDLSQFNLNRTDEDLFKSNYKMLNMRQLNESIDTLTTLRNSHYVQFKEGIKRSYMHYADIKEDTLNPKIKTAEIVFDTLVSNLSKTQHKQIYLTAANLSRNAKSRIGSMVEDLNNRDKYIRYHEIYWHKKITLSFACFILFLIGAPLGAIIRKGGLGMPIVISVAFFLIFHMISITGEKFAKEGALPVMQGMWLATAVLLPIGILITYKATTDSSLMKIGNFKNPFKRKAAQV